MLILDIRKFCFLSDNLVNSVFQVDGQSGHFSLYQISPHQSQITISPPGSPHSILAGLLALSPAPLQSILNKEAGMMLLKVYLVTFLSAETRDSAPSKSESYLRPIRLCLILPPIYLLASSKTSFPTTCLARPHCFLCSLIGQRCSHLKALALTFPSFGDTTSAKIVMTTSFTFYV